MKYNRIKWTNNNALLLYNFYFAPFMLNNCHTLAFISDYLENICVFEEYDRIYLNFFIKKLS
jgi:hypothetical protein